MLSKFSIKISHLTSTGYRLLSDRLLSSFTKKEPVLASYPFLSLLRRRNPEQHTACPNVRSEKRKSKLKMIGRPQIQRRIQAHIL